MPSKPLSIRGSMLQVNDLKIAYPHRQVLKGVSFTLAPHETLGIVGRSGSGKSTLAKAIPRFIPQATGSILFQGTELMALSERALRPIRKQIRLIAQDPNTSLNPTLKIGVQLLEETPYDAAYGMEILARFGIKHPKTVFHSYPFEISGGEKQRVAIALAMIMHPPLIIADEPTTALDAPLQTHILDLLMSLETTLIVISHNPAVIRRVARRVLTMEGGLLQ